MYVCIVYGEEAEESKMHKYFKIIIVLRLGKTVSEFFSHMFASSNMPEQNGQNDKQMNAIRRPRESEIRYFWSLVFLFSGRLFLCAEDADRILGITSPLVVSYILGFFFCFRSDHDFVNFRHK
jgi:hypothetical protein